MDKNRIDDFIDLIIMMFFAGLIYCLSKCFDFDLIYQSVGFFSRQFVEIICIIFMILMIFVYYKEYTVLSLLMVGLSPYIFYQYILLLYEYVIFRYIFYILTLFYILFYLLLIFKYDEKFNIKMMINRYCMIMFCIMYIIVVVNMFIPKSENIHDVTVFSLDEYQETLVKFRKDQWEDLDIKDKQEALNEFVVIDLMYLLGEEDKDIEVYIKALDSESTRGYYSFKSEEIVINENVLLDRDKLISVLLHESYHRYQHKVINALEDKIDLKMKIIRDVNEWKDNIYHYISADDNYEDYYNQRLEKDAREYSNMYTAMYIKFIDNLKENENG